MLVQSTLALALFGLVVARAVNAFTYEDPGRTRDAIAAATAAGFHHTGGAIGVPGRDGPRVGKVSFRLP